MICPECGKEVRCIIFNEVKTEGRCPVCEEVIACSKRRVEELLNMTSLEEEVIKQKYQNSNDY